MTTALDDHDDLDRISKLPESTLHHIQSFLTFKNIVQLSVLSKTWKQVSIYQPNLTFDSHFFRFNSCIIADRDQNIWVRCPNRMQDKFRQSCVFIDQILRPFREQGLNVNKFELDMFIFDLDWLSYIDQWIQQAINQNVRELTLWFGWLFPPQYIYPLPVFILLAKSVVTLKLKRCKLPSVDRYFKTNLSSLKKLFLRQVELSDDLPQDIFDLTLSYCKGMSSLRISDPVKLKKLEVNQNYNLENVYIDASSLVEVKFTGENLKIFDIKKCPALENLHLNIVWGNNNNNNNNKVTISSCSLKFLKIKMQWYPPSIIEINAPNLSEFTYFGHAPELSLNAPSLESCLFDLGVDNEYITPEYSSHLKEIEFLSNFNHCRNVNLSCQNVKLLMVPKGVRDVRVSPLPNVEKLKITIRGDKTLETNEELMDSLFWISPRSEIFGKVVTRHRLSTYIFKFFKDETVSENEFVAIAHPAVSTDRIEEDL
ncbi:hypothetical protein ACFE04_028554 [Oxalis oulophora]